MLHPSTKRLIDKLDEMTRRQRVAWEESDDGSITHDTEGYRVVLTAAPHAMRLTDALGREIETCGPEDFNGETDASGRPYADFVADLYREAHRHARGAEKAISALLSSLDEAGEEIPPAAPVTAVLPEPESFDHVEDEGDDSQPIEGLTALDGEEEDMQKAVAAMADEVNNGAHGIADAEEMEPAGIEFAAEEPVAEVVVESQPEPVFAAPAPEPEPYAPFAGATDSAVAYAVASEFPEPPVPVEAETEATETFLEELTEFMPEPEPVAAPQPEPRGTFLQPEPAPEPSPVSAPQPEPAPVQRPAPVFGGGMFSGGMGDLSRYRTQAPAAPGPEATVPAAAPAAEAAPTQQPEPQPEPEPAPAPMPQRFSLSGITSGFGLGSTHPAARPQPPLQQAAEPAPAPQVDTSEPAPRKIIDGTVDLPDMIPDAAPHSGYRMEEDEGFGFTDADLMPGVAASPLPPKENESPAESAEEAPEGESRPHPARRFNPWN
ncbi:MAG: hypothetical protein R3C08_00160 [Hyphomonas sp.]|nr:hypothetical protein [Hyphomonas sp.]HRX72527.1 hypothetical protein [Hyphomonas sp.]